MDNLSHQDTQVTSRNEKWIIFVTGLTACGKTTVAKYLAAEMGLEYVEGDDVSSTLPSATQSLAYARQQYHPKANVEKMSRGQPLNDEDREGWLVALRNESE